MAEPILQLRDVSLSFKGIKALNELSFDVDGGEICALIGPNGAGKSSLLNVINGVYRADAGEVVFDGRRFDGDPSARGGTARHRSRPFSTTPCSSASPCVDNVLAGLTRHSADQAVRACLRLPARPQRGRALSASAPTISSISSGSDGHIATRSSPPCPMACRSASTSPARW